MNKKIISTKLLICGLGFYKLHINGNDLTKGALAHYMSVPDDVIFYDRSIYVNHNYSDTAKVIIKHAGIN